MSSLQLVRDTYDAFNRGDIATVPGTFDAGIEWREAEANPHRPSGSPRTGGDAITQNPFINLGSEWDGFTTHPESFHDAGDTAVVEWRHADTYKATGKVSTPSTAGP